MTNKDGLLGATNTISGLDWGVYYFYEVKAPAGYQRDTTPQVFKVDASNVGSKIEVNMSDEKTYGKIWLYKQAKKANDDNSHNKLFGAKFSLYTKSNEQVYAVPRLALNGLKNSADGVTDGQKEFLVKKITVDEKNKITFQLEEGYNITVQYEESKDGNITVVTPDSAFIAMYVEGDTYSPVLNDTRLTYYIVTKDKSKVFDNDMKKYRNITATELTCLSDTYITADTGGQFCVRGLDWGSYYFREIVPPEGYGLADDVIFTVNAYNCDNQFLACEDPEASAAIIVDKEIPDADYFKAYGEPTFMFKVYGLTEASAQDSVDYTKNNKNYKKNGSEYTLAIHLTEPNTKGTAMINVPVGQYLIEELPISRYVCCGLELVEGSEDETIKVKSAGMDTPTSTLIASDTSKYDINNGSEAKPWTAFCDLSGGDSEFGEVVTFHIKYTNEIQQYDNFSYVSFADNQIPGQEYIAAFKPLYTPLITVNNGADDYIYSIDLAKALTEGDFEAVLSYNTEKIEKLTDLTHIQFSNANKAPIKKVEFDGTTLKVTVSNPVSLAGQAISIDVGYCEDSNFTAYNESNTNMVKGTLTLTFSEVKADVRKRVILKNDVTNKTYFPYADPEKQTKDVTSVALIYTQDAEDADNITEVLENTDYTDTLTVKDPTSYQFESWYLLNSDGKPVLDKSGEVLNFLTKDEIETFIFTGTFPSYLTEDNLITEEMQKITADTSKINSYTFQAQIHKVMRPTSVLMSKANLRTTLSNLVDTDLTKIYAINERVTKEPETYYKKAIISDVSDTNYTTVTWAYSVPNGNGYDIVFMTEDNTEPLLTGDCSSLFDGFSNLSSITGLEHIYTSDSTFDKTKYSLENAYKMFISTRITAFNLSGWDVSQCTNFGGMFDVSGMPSNGTFTLNLAGWDVSNTGMNGSDDIIKESSTTLLMRNLISPGDGTGSRGKVTFIDISNWKLPNTVTKIDFNKVVTKKPDVYVVGLESYSLTNTGYANCHYSY